MLNIGILPLQTFASNTGCKAVGWIKEFNVKNGLWICRTASLLKKVFRAASAIPEPQ